MPRFEHIISMGCACGTAYSMEKYGLRNCAGPFDWCVSRFDSSVHFIETKFSDFLDKNNIKIGGNNTEFFDEKYGFYFANDVVYDLSEEWDLIYEKYQRRIKRFLDMIQCPTCLVRCIKDQQERDYISKNGDYISSVIKKYNQSNEMIFLGNEDLELQSPFKYYPLKIDTEDPMYVGRNVLFDGNYNIIKFLSEGMAAEAVEKNIFFTKGRESKREKGIKCRYMLAMKLLKCKEEDLKNIPSDIAIYGSGNIGKSFFEKCRHICKVECFIDKRPKENSYQDIKCIHYTELGSVNTMNFIVTPIYELETISKIILKYKPNANIIALDKII